MLTLGVIGAGKTSDENAVALVSDYIAASDQEDIQFVFGMTPDWNDTHSALLDFVFEEEYDLHIIHDEESLEDDVCSEILESLEEEEKTKTLRVPKHLVSKVDEEKGEKKIVIIWKEGGDEDPEDLGMTTLELADSEGIECLDLTDGLDPIQFEDDSGESGEEPEQKSEKKKDSAKGKKTYTEDDLWNMDRKDVQQLVEDEGLDISTRKHTKTLIAALVDHYGTSGEEGAAEEEPAPEKKDRRGRGRQKKDKEPTPEYVEQQGGPSPEIDYDKLGKVVGDAVEEAVKPLHIALGENTEQLQALAESVNNLGEKSSSDGDGKRGRRRAPRRS